MLRHLSGGAVMKHLHRLFLAGHLAIIALFFAAAVSLVVLAASELWHGAIMAGTDAGLRGRFDNILESIGMLTIGLVALELAQTVFEEEVQRDVKVSGPTRVRRYLSRFLVVIVIALSIETLVATFELMHEDPRQLPYVIAIGGSAARRRCCWWRGAYSSVSTAAPRNSNPRPCSRPSPRTTRSSDAVLP